eukprot:10935675-Prorocentrum_lima.AAC.1
MPTNEVCNEEKHARVAVGKKQKPHLGPVFISLTNRWKHIDIEQRLRDAQGMKQLLNAFARCRNLMVAASRL